MDDADAEPHRPTVLIVDDDEGIAFLLTYYFRRWGWLPVVAVNVAEAVALLNPGLSLIVLDLMLPDRSGVDVIREHHARGMTAPVAVLTGKELWEAVGTVGEFKPDALFLKKYDLDDLRIFAAGVMARLRGDTAPTGV